METIKIQFENYQFRGLTENFFIDYSNNKFDTENTFFVYALLDVFKKIHKKVENNYLSIDSLMIKIKLRKNEFLALYYYIKNFMTWNNTTENYIILNELDKLKVNNF